MPGSKSSFLFAAIWLSFVTILLCIPGTKLPAISWQDKIWLDKWIHVILFSILVFTWCRAYADKKDFIKIAMAGIVYGIVMEIVQKYFIPFRSFDVRDMIADSAGCAVGYFFSMRNFNRR